MNGWLRGLDAAITSPVGRSVLSAWQALAAVVLPQPCALCVWSDAAVHQLCLPCVGLIKEHFGQVVQAQEFADSLPLGLVSGRPLPVFAASFYTPELARVLLQYKDHQRIGLAQLFRPVMYRTLDHAANTLQTDHYRLVPIPASGASFRRRGYNPVTTLLPAVLPQRLTYDRRVLKTRWHLNTRAAHHGSNRRRRRIGSVAKFRLARRRRQPAEPIVLADDVLTTGATLAAATRVLERGGYDVIAAVVLAAVPPRD